MSSRHHRMGEGRLSWSKYSDVKCEEGDWRVRKKQTTHEPSQEKQTTHEPVCIN